ncbi:hypothetical protein [Photobacterium japonica]
MSSGVTLTFIHRGTQEHNQTLGGQQIGLVQASLFIVVGVMT